MTTKAEVLFNQAYLKGGDTPRDRLRAALEFVIPSGTRGIRTIEARQEAIRMRRGLIPARFGRVQLDASRFNRMSALLRGVVRRAAAESFEPLTRKCLAAKNRQQFRDLVTGEPVDRWLSRARRVGDYQLGVWLLPPASSVSRSAKAGWKWGLNTAKETERGYKNHWVEWWSPAWHIDYSRSPAVLRIAACNKGTAPYLPKDYLVLDEHVRDAYKHWQVAQRLGVTMNQDVIVNKLIVEQLLPKGETA